MIIFLVSRVFFSLENSIIDLFNIQYITLCYIDKLTIITHKQHNNITPNSRTSLTRSNTLVMSSLTDKNLTATGGDDSNDDDDGDEVIVQSFVDAIPSENRKALISELQSFVVRHASHHRPIALVSSGGTAADLEIHSVRCLDNFSTGKRGAISVEELLKRGYAVIHLWRRGSASPYGRVLSQAIMGPSSTPNQGISIGSLGKLFATGDQEEDQDDQLVQDVLDAQNSNGNDNTNTNNTNKRSNNNNSNSTKKSSSLFKGGIHLHRRIINSTPLRTALIERQSALEEGRILTIPFRSVEEYLAKLQLSSESLRDSQALAMFFLCGAVSDFYVPLAERSTHKIQSRDVSHQDSNNNNQMLSKEKESNCLNLKLWPVPKVMGLLRRKWAPDAFVCSFKLETDKAILRKKAEGAVEKYGCHMVVGNLLKTRYDQVYILAPADMETLMHNGSTNDNIDKTSNEHKSNSGGVNWKVQDWPMQEISRPKASEPDALEAMIMENVVQMHFEYISTSISGSLDKSGTESVLRAHLEIEQKKRSIEKELFWNQVQSVVLEWGGILAGAALSVAISTALRRRINV
jgi:phosphopantothenoylcysteine synthetase/decarboxylase